VPRSSRRVVKLGLSRPSPSDQCTDWQANARKVKRLQTAILSIKTILAPFMALSGTTHSNLTCLDMYAGFLFAVGPDYFLTFTFKL
jgi:hypothetical protein